MLWVYFPDSLLDAFVPSLQADLARIRAAKCQEVCRRQYTPSFDRGNNAGLRDKMGAITYGSFMGL